MALSSCNQSVAPDGASNPVACKAGTFVGKVEDGVTEFANVCPQPDGYHLADVSGDDFLALNIWTVDNRMKKKPVMVYVHGGG